MIRIVALGLTYMALLFGFAAGMEALAGKECSDWLVECSSEQVAAVRPAENNQDSQPEPPELR